VRRSARLAFTAVAITPFAALPQLARVHICTSTTTSLSKHPNSDGLAEEYQPCVNASMP